MTEKSADRELTEFNDDFTAFMEKFIKESFALRVDSISSAFVGLPVQPKTYEFEWVPTRRFVFVFKGKVHWDGKYCLNADMTLNGKVYPLNMKRDEAQTLAVDLAQWLSQNLARIMGK